MDNHLSSVEPDQPLDFHSFIQAVCDGDDASTTQLWELYFERIGRAVGSRLTSRGKRYEDHEDVANSVLRTFFRRASLGQFKQLGDQDQLWKLLLTIAIRKASDYRKRSMAARRGGGLTVLGQDGLADDASLSAIELAASPQSDSPEAQVLVQELFESVMRRMPDDRTRDVVLLHLQGADKQQIAELQTCSIRTVERRMQNAISIWTDAVAE